ncbi:uncharacterized protein VICG_01919 [Vittaforma corneae ATCC 50505]|uniref:OB domain-containing protein n=1 Tax=Vittaforma corneae (strain ATCC 50505) TaxID=993615 RepID=L2GL57_VITCO|nr:uncharacterized protein VICG_01919 [Vittaforma corneae ATCC 50505]ELA41037.1 hypothetical protein VICG_01919 [Vittaforma corneae ATCC 50505]
MEEFEGGFLQSSQKHEYTGVKTLRCLSNKQINSISTDDSSSVPIVDRFEVSNVQVCGYVTSFKKISTGFIFEVDDTTGKIECAFWTNGSFEELSADQIKEGALLKLTGSIKIFASKKTLNVSTICTVDGNALTYHLTSCLYQHLFFTNKLERKDERRPSIGFSKIQNDILEVYKNNQDSEGLDIEVVVAMLRDKYSESDIRNTVEGLLSNCHLYSVDGTCYKTTI